MKTFVYKAYDASGNFLQTWDDVVGEPSFSQEINSPGSELLIRLARKADSFGEEVDVKFKNVIKVYVSDIDTTDPELLFQGYIADYSPAMGDEEYIDVIVFSFGTELDNYILEVEEQPNQSQTSGALIQDYGPSLQIAQSFIPSVTSLSSVDLKLYSTTPVTTTLSVHTNNAGTPSSSAITNGTVVKEITDTSMTVNRFIFGTPPTLTPGNTYWLVVTGS